MPDLEPAFGGGYLQSQIVGPGRIIPTRQALHKAQKDRVNPFPLPFRSGKFNTYPKTEVDAWYERELALRVDKDKAARKKIYSDLGRKGVKERQARRAAA